MGVPQVAIPCRGRGWYRYGYREQVTWLAVSIMERSKSMSIFRIFYAGGSIDIGADDFNIVNDGSRVLFIRDKENIACYVLANITGFVKVE